MEAQLALEVQGYKACAWADNTKRAYATHRRTYLKFCALLRRNPAPADERLVCLFAAWLARSLSYKSIKLYLHIITLIHKERGLPSPCIENFQLSQTLRGIRRVKGDRVSPKAPITPELLSYIRSRLDLSKSRDRAVWAASMVMFVGLLRRSNVMPPSVVGFAPDKHLCRSDISVTDQGYQVIIKWSKTNQFRQTPTRIYLPRKKGHPLCPVMALYLVLREAPKDGRVPGIGYYEQGVYYPLTPPTFIQVLREALTGAGVEPASYAGHSFRRGGATWLHNCGASTEMIKLTGQWSSECYHKYITPGDRERQQTSVLLVNSLP